MKLTMKNYLILMFVLFFSSFSVAKIAKAGGSYHSTTIYETTESTIINTWKGVAAAIATSNHQFDFSTTSWQGSLSIGSSQTGKAFSFGLAKRFKHTLISGSITNEGGEYYGGGAVRFNF